MSEKGYASMGEHHLQKFEHTDSEAICDKTLNKEILDSSDTQANINQELCDFLLQNMTQEQNGHIVSPLLWNRKVAENLSRNFELAKSILYSNLKKLQKTEGRLQLYDNVIKEQLEMGIIEEIPDIQNFLKENPACSFLAHMGVFRPGKETTKCRVVFLSNLAQKSQDGSLTVSHNQAMLSGPSINRKISTAIMQLRFDRKLIIWDLCKAFLQIKLLEADKNRLCFLWIKNADERNFEIKAYKMNRLPFGLVCSPTILMTSLFKMLCVDSNSNSTEIQTLKNKIYDLAYMDNLAYSTDSKNELHWAYDQLMEMFASYVFELQQFCTNDLELQKRIDAQLNCTTPTEVSMLGMLWDRELDTISTNKMYLDENADTKRKVLSTLAANYDIFNINCPLLNRARLYMQTLQVNTKLKWDSILPQESLEEWKLICKQLNSAPICRLERFFGNRTDSYRLIGFCDASTQLYGSVLYIQNVGTGLVKFLMAKPHVIGTNLQGKTVPSLELHALKNATENLIEVYRELTGELTLFKINIVDISLYTDSMISLNWISSYAYKFEKLQKRGPFIINRLREIDRLCSIFPIKFSFIRGEQIPRIA